MKSNKWTNAEWIRLTSKGYYWNCPTCCACNIESQFENLVECCNCHKSFRATNDKTTSGFGGPDYEDY